MPPAFSIIVPTRDRPEPLARCLAALSDLDYPRERFAVIIVNDGGKPLDVLIAPFQDRLNITAIWQKNAGPAAARNAGAARANGRYLAFTDDDCCPDRAWLKEFERQFADDPNVLVGGRIVNALKDNLYSAASQLLVTYLYGYYNAARQQASFLTSNNMAIAREAFLAAGGFDVTFPLAAAEDREICDRWTHSGRRIVYAENALVRHSHQLTLPSFWRQHFHYGQGARRYRQVRATRTAGRMRIEPLRFYTGLLRYPWTAGAPRPFSTSALLFLAQIANVLGFFGASSVVALHN